MAEYIKRETVIKHLRECEGTPPEICYTYPIFKAIERFVEGVPAADVVEVEKYEEIVYKLECLLCHATGNRYSKATYKLEDMERMVTDYIEECCEEAVEDAVVRCKDCKFYEIHKPKVLENCERNGHLIPMKPDDSCSYGERRDS